MKAHDGAGHGFERTGIIEHERRERTSALPLLNDFLVQLDQRRHLAEHSSKALLPRLQLFELIACP